MEREFGTTVPEDVEVTVLEESAKHAYIVLPMQPSAELSDEDLDAASGAGDVYSTFFGQALCPVNGRVMPPA